MINCEMEKKYGFIIKKEFIYFFEVNINVEFFEFV